MWKQLWKRWTIEKPAAFGDWMWEVLVVQLAALLDRVTVRDVIAFIPVLDSHRGLRPQHPASSRIDAARRFAGLHRFSVLFLLGIFSRITTVVFIVKQAAARALQFAIILRDGMQRIRHRREGGAKQRKRLTDRARNDDDGLVAIKGLAWA